MASNVRDRSSGQYQEHNGKVPAGESHPKVSKLDLAKNPTKPVVNTLQRPVLDAKDGRARPHPGDSGPTVEH